MRNPKSYLLILVLMLFASGHLQAQELNAKISINRSQVSNTKGGVFEALEKKVADFLNEHKWTALKLKESEKIQCNFNITVNTYSETNNNYSFRKDKKQKSPIQTFSQKTTTSIY